MNWGSFFDFIWFVGAFWIVGALAGFFVAVAVIKIKDSLEDKK